MDFFEALAELEATPELHCARLLVLIEAFAGEDGTLEIEGLTKLAKLDFFLRYPVMLERALEVRKRSISAAELQPFERNSVESKMVRYKYGPWDHRYWQLLSILVAKGLIRVRRKGLGRMIGVTPLGKEKAQELASTDEFAVVARRARALEKSMNLTATNIMRFVYDTFPEIASLKLNRPIES
jgi:hypothetical protein